MLTVNSFLDHPLDWVNYSFRKWSSTHPAPSFVPTYTISSANNIIDDDDNDLRKHVDFSLASYKFFKKKQNRANIELENREKSERQNREKFPGFAFSKPGNFPVKPGKKNTA